MDVSAPDETAFREMYERTSRRVYAYLRRSADPLTAENVLSEVFLKAWRHADHLPEDPVPWLLLTAKTTLYDHWRAEGRRERLAHDVHLISRDDTQPGADDLAVDRAMLQSALRALAQADREALLLVGWDGLSHADAAKVAGCSVMAFKARVNRARHRLTQLLLESPEAPVLRSVRQEA